MFSLTGAGYLPGIPVYCSATGEGLRQEFLYLPGPADGELVFFALFVDAKNCDDVLEILER